MPGNAWLSFSGTVFDVEKLVTNPGRRPMLRPEEMLVAVMQHIPRIFTTAAPMILDLCMGTGATGSDSLMEKQHRKCTGYDNDVACVEKITTSLLEPIARYILKENSHIIENVELVNAERSNLLLLQA